MTAYFYIFNTRPQSKRHKLPIHFSTWADISSYFVTRHERQLSFKVGMRRREVQHEALMGPAGEVNMWKPRVRTHARGPCVGHRGSEACKEWQLQVLRCALLWGLNWVTAKLSHVAQNTPFICCSVYQTIIHQQHCRNSWYKLIQDIECFLLFRIQNDRMFLKWRPSKAASLRAAVYASL